MREAIVMSIHANQLVSLQSGQNGPPVHNLVAGARSKGLEHWKTIQMHWVLNVEQ
jgi:hypothetical protein